ncbi:hypothetical protein [Kushneria phosphatilytica]|uniref:Uncharacterized protein n=1 Tax=Kushneria phosphatilytica TaxID=657387 RepID=A0A5C1A0G6_9GAMM|nr:hypothetical protein [Kushneria phosphatilytica]QEL12362.1 hypothetical protein FY550_15275 [Kushneria phosphatilytica]
MHHAAQLRFGFENVRRNDLDNDAVVFAEPVMVTLNGRPHQLLDPSTGSQRARILSIRDAMLSQPFPWCPLNHQPCPLRHMALGHAA